MDKMSHAEIASSNPTKRKGNPAWGNGKSGNPNGRPKRSLMDVKEMARAHTKETFQRVIGMMRQQKNDNIALRAAEIILNRGWGMPSQDVKLNADLTIGIAAIVADARKRVATIIDAQSNDMQLLETSTNYVGDTRDDPVPADRTDKLEANGTEQSDTEQG